MSIFFSGPAYQPPVFETDRQRADEANQKRLLGTDSGLLGAGFMLAPTAQFIYDLGGLQYDEDPAWNPTAQDIEQIGTGLEPKYWPFLATARSADHAQYLRQQMFDRQTADEIVSQNGWSGTGAWFLGQVLDPSFVIGTAGAGALLRAPIIAATGSRAAAEAAVGVAGMAGPQLYMQATDPTVEVRETVFALSSAALLGGLAGGIAGRLSPKEKGAFSALARAAEADEMVESSGAMGAMGSKETRDAIRRQFLDSLDEKGKRYFASLKPRQQKEMLAQMADGADSIDQELIEQFKKSKAGTAFAQAAADFTPAPPVRTREAIDPNVPRVNNNQDQAATTTITVYRGSAGDLPSGKHLSGVRDVMEVADGEPLQAPTVPLKFYTTDPDDAARYAQTDQIALSRYEKDDPGRGAEVFKTLHGHDPRPSGSVSKADIAPQKVFDMTWMGAKGGDQFKLIRLVNDALGNKPLPNKWTWKDLPENVDKLLFADDAPLAGASAIGTESPAPTWLYFRNAVNSADMRLADPKHPNHKPISQSKLVGTNFVNWVKSRGYDSIAYMHDTPKGPVKHYAMIEDAAKPTTATAATKAAPGTVQKAYNDADFEHAIAGNRISMGFLRPGNTPGISNNTSFFGKRASKLVRTIGAAVMDDPLAKLTETGQRAPSGDNALAFVRRTTKGLSAKFRAKLTGEESKWFQFKGIKPDATESRWFREQVGRSMAGANIEDTFVRRVAQQGDEILKDMFDRLKRAGVIVNEATNYFPRVLSPARYNTIVAERGEDAAFSAFRYAISRMNPNAKPEALDRVAKTMVKGIQRLGLMSANDADRVMVGAVDEIEGTLRAGLADENGVISEQAENAIKTLMDELGAQAADRGSGKPAFTRSRVLLDEFAVDPDTGLKVDDFLERDAEVIIEKYVRSAAGLLAEKEVLRVAGLSIDATGNTPVSSWQAMKELAEVSLRESGEESKIADVLYRMDIAHRMIRGFPLKDGDMMRKVAGYATMYNQSVLGGSFVLANIPEAVATIAETPVKNTLDAVKAIGGLANMVKLGKIPDNAAGEIMTLTGRGSEYALADITARFDPIEGTFVQPGRIERGLRGLTQFQSKYTGFAAINDGMQRYSVMAFASEILDKASKGVSLGSKNRMLALGLDEDTWAAIGRNAKHVQRGEVDGVKNVITSFGLDRWEPQAAARFVSAVQRNSERMIQQHDFGQMMPWMTTWWGRIITQLRTFTISAWDKQMLHGLHTIDAKTLARFTTGTVSGALVYIARQHASAVGKDESERRRFLRDRLSNERIAAAAWANGGYSSLTPDIIDWSKYAFVDRFDHDSSPVFTARYSQLESRGLLSNPTTSSLANAGRAFKGAMEATTDDGVFSQRDAEAFTKLLPLQNALGIRQLLNYGVSQFRPDPR
jgi:hypothetical protein